MSAKLLKALIQTGHDLPENEALKRNIFISNSISLILFGFAIALSIVVLAIYQKYLLPSMILVAGGVFLVPIFLNSKGYTKIGRFLLSLSVPAAAIWISIISKQSYFDLVQPIDFFDVRFLLIASSIVPLSTINLSEKSFLWISLLPGFLALALYDPLHNYLGLGYFDAHLESRDYYFAANFYPFLAYFFIVGSFLFLKINTESFEKSNELLIADLKTQRYEIEQQNNEILAQSEELITNQDQLVEANKIIEAQREKLIGQNAALQDELLERNEQLSITNQELIKHNNELLQFSYTVSHNLRGPVARLLGLSALFNTAHTDDDRKDIINMIQKSSVDLDTVLHDLTKIIDIRNEVYAVREKIYLEQEMVLVKNLLRDSLRPEFEITTDFSKAPFIYGVRPMINSILLNLVSNAIKYRSPDRPLKLSIQSLKQSDKIQLDVTDNGLGIDLTSFKADLFRMYKRFHPHIEGKGLGLYLVKTQTEVLGGSIEVESEINRGTAFRLRFSTPPSVQKQVFFESDGALLYFDANINSTFIIWKRNVNSEEYRTAFNKMLETLRIYNTPQWIADLRLQGAIAEEDQVWFLTYIIPEAVRNGLLRVAAIGFSDPVRENYYQRMSHKVKDLGVTLKPFESLDKAKSWISTFLVNQG